MIEYAFVYAENSTNKYLLKNKNFSNMKYELIFIFIVMYCTSVYIVYSSVMLYKYFGYDNKDR